MLLAGFEQPDDGEIFVKSARVTSLLRQQRGTPKPDIGRRVADALRKARACSVRPGSGFVPEPAESADRAVHLPWKPDESDRQALVGRNAGCAAARKSAAPTTAWGQRSISAGSNASGRECLRPWRKTISTSAVFRLHFVGGRAGGIAERCPSSTALPCPYGHQ